MTTVAELLAAVPKPEELVDAIERLEVLRLHGEALKVRINECRGLVGDGRPFDPSPLLHDQRLEVVRILRDFVAEGRENDAEIQKQVRLVADLWREHREKLTKATSSRSFAALARIADAIDMLIEALGVLDKIDDALLAAGGQPEKRVRAEAVEPILVQILGRLVGRRNERRAA
jgi:hypothetical protein